MSLTPPPGPASVADLLREPLAVRPDQEALVDRRHRYTYRQLEDLVAGVAAGLAARGLGPGDRVAVSLPNRADTVVSYLAVMRLGGVFVGLHPGLAAVEKDRLLADAEPALVITAGARTPVPSHVPGEVLAIDLEGDGIAALARPPGPSPLRPVDPAAPAAIAYTSGTTGLPKGVVHDQRHLLLTPQVILHDRLGGRGERVGVYLPLTTLNLLILGPTLAFLGGGTCVCIDTHEAGALADWIRRERVEHMSSSPAVVHDLVEQPGLGPGELGELRLGVGGATCPERLRAAYRERFGRDFTTGYGLSEAPTAVSQEHEGVPHRPGASGLAVANVRLLVLDGEHAAMPAGEEGEIAIGPATTGAWARRWTGMLGYWRQPDATARSRHGELLLTGDRGRLDADGYLYVADRHHELINRGGSKVSPAEVERALREHPAVADGIALGRPHDRLGEEVVAAVELRAGRAITSSELQAHCRTLLAGYKVPTQITVVERLPRNPMGKIVREDARRLLAEVAAPLQN